MPDLRPRYCKMAPDSNTEIGFPSGPSGSTMAGMRLFGAILRNAGSNCSPRMMLTYLTSYGRPHSSSMIVILWPLGVGQKWSSMGFRDIGTVPQVWWLG